MNFRTPALWAGIAAIPGWYVYRTLSEHRVSRIEWNQIFLTETERLQMELKAEKEQAREELRKAEDELSAKSMRLKAESEIQSCIDLAARTRSDFDAVAEEQTRWKNSVDPLLRTRAGTAITEKGEYVHAFEEFYLPLAPEESMKADASEIEGIAKECEALRSKKPPELSLHAQIYRLGQLQEKLQRMLAARKESRRKIELLRDIANGQAAANVEIAIERQKITSLFEKYKWDRERERMLGHP